METKDIIPWSKGYFLSWQDFQAEPNPAAFQDSFSHIKYHHTWTINSSMIDGQIFFSIIDIQLSTQFLRHLSWVRQQHATTALLRHEQGHFDLAELFRSEIIYSLKDKFQGMQFPTRGQNDEQRKQYAKEQSGILIAKELEIWTKKILEEREKYDNDTSFGNNIEKQKFYDEKFVKLRV